MPDLSCHYNLSNKLIINYVVSYCTRTSIGGSKDNINYYGVILLLVFLLKFMNKFCKLWSKGDEDFI